MKLFHIISFETQGDTKWNIITLPEPVTTSSVKITVTDVYGTINNGFKEIEIYENQEGVVTENFSWGGGGTPCIDIRCIEDLEV